MAVGKVSAQHSDYGGEKGTTTFYIPELTAANIDANIATNGNVDDIIAAIEGISLGALVKYSISAKLVESTGGFAGSAFAQRETKWLVTYKDTVTGKFYQMEIPCADLALLVANDDKMNVASGAGQTFVNEFESKAVSPDGNAVEFMSARHVGRNL